MLKNNIHTNLCTSTTTNCCFVECTSTTTLPCINPIDQLFKIAAKVSEANSYSKLEALEQVLDNGFILNSCGMCCPECIYIFTNDESYEEIIEARFNIFGAVEKSTSNCCLNVYGTTLEFGDFCCNNFVECVESIFDHFSKNSCETSSVFGIDNLLEVYLKMLGKVIEQGTIGNESQVCRIFENMKSYFETTCLLDEFFTILEKGIVINCKNDKMFISSVQTYIDNFLNVEP